MPDHPIKQRTEQIIAHSESLAAAFSAEPWVEDAEVGYDNTVCSVFITPDYGPQTRVHVDLAEEWTDADTEELGRGPPPEERLGYITNYITWHGLFNVDIDVGLDISGKGVHINEAPWGDLLVDVVRNVKAQRMRGEDPEPESVIEIRY